MGPLGKDGSKTMTTESITISAATVSQLLSLREVAAQINKTDGSKESAAILRTLEATMELIGIVWDEQKAEEPKPVKVEEAKEDERPTVTEYPTDDRMFQLQTSVTRYHDGFHSDYDHDHTRNYKTLKSAMRTAKKMLKDNDLPKVMRCEREVYGPRTCDSRLHFYAEDGHEFTYKEDYAVWHIDGVRIIDRVTKKVLWEA